MSVVSNQTFDKHSLFDFTADCNKFGVPEQCGIGTDSDGNIIFLGPWQRGTFEPKADIAGPGVPMLFYSPCQKAEHLKVAD